MASNSRESELRRAVVRLRRAAEKAKRELGAVRRFASQQDSAANHSATAYSGTGDSATGDSAADGSRTEVSATDTSYRRVEEALEEVLEFTHSEERKIRERMLESGGVKRGGTLGG